MKAIPRLAGSQQIGNRRKIWRRSYDIPPPPARKVRRTLLGNDPRYAGIPEAELPLTERLEGTVARFLPLWQETIAPVVKSGKRVIIAAHGNNLRALVMYLNNLTEEEVLGLNIPTGGPLVDEWRRAQTSPPLLPWRPSRDRSGHGRGREPGQIEIILRLRDCLNKEPTEKSALLLFGASS